ncbi:DUF2172 domain-containing protein [Nocardioides ungokensis]
MPYRTTYYKRTWGFCLTQRQLDAMGEGPSRWWWTPPWSPAS